MAQQEKRTYVHEERGRANYSAKGGCAALFRPPLTPSLIYATVGVEHELVLDTDSAPVRRCSVKPFQLGQTV